MRTFAESPALSQEPKAADRNQSNLAARTGSRSSVQRRQTFDFSPIPRFPGIPGVIQTKLAINRPGDEFEQEADRISERVMRMPEPQLQPKCACGGSCSNCKGETPDEQPTGLQLKRVNGSVSGLREAPTLVHDVLRSPGQPLDASTRAFMEPRFGHDFSRVRVHASSAGEESAKQINAHAYTLGSNIVFGSGQYAPGTTDGRRLLAHELTHVVQQTGDGLWSMHDDSRVQRDALEPPSGDMSDEEVEENPQFSIQRRAIGSDTGGLTPPGIPLTTGGSPLPDGTRQYFERRFGRDFSDVRVHTGSPADDANRGLNSHAFTFGNHIWLGSGQIL